MRRSPNRNFTAFMAGRYGADALGRFLSVCGCVCILISIAVRGKNAFFRCPSCKEVVRVPRGKGKIRITCPRCGYAFEKKT